MNFNYNTNGMKDISKVINKACKKLENAKRDYGNFKKLAPLDFSYRASLIEISDYNIPSIKQKLIGIANFIYDKAEEFEKISNMNIGIKNFASLNNGLSLFNIDNLNSIFELIYNTGAYITNSAQSILKTNPLTLLNEAETFAVTKLKETGSFLSNQYDSIMLWLLTGHTLKEIKEYEQFRKTEFIGYIKSTKDLAEAMNKIIEKNLKNSGINDVIKEKNQMLKYYKACLLSDNGDYKSNSPIVDTLFDKYDSFTLDEKLRFITYRSLWNEDYKYEYRSYGIDQGFIKKMSPNDQKELAKFIANKYNFKDLSDATRIIEGIDVDVGVCSYATLAESIAIEYMEKPDEFKKKFGYDLYVKDINGKYCFNEGKILADIYVGININETSLFENTKDGKKILKTKDTRRKGYVKVDQTDFEGLSRSRYYNNNQVSGAEWDEDRVNNYLNSKGINVNTYILNKDDFLLTNNNKSKYNKNDILKAIEEITESSSSPVIIQMKINEAVFNKGFHVNFYEDSTKKNNPNVCQGGHIFSVVGVENNKIVVNTWGERYYLDLDELCNDPDVTFGFVLTNIKDI